MSHFTSREGKTIPKTRHKEEVVHKGVKYSIRLDNIRNKIKKTPKKVNQAILEGIMKIPKFVEELQDNKEDDGQYLESGLRYYEKFKKRTGQIIIPVGHIEDHFDLFGWNKKVRARRKLNDLFKTRILKIDPLFFSAHTLRIFAQEIQPRIEAFIQENGHALISQRYVCVDGYLLGEKVSDLRTRRIKLPKPISNYLDSLGDKWAWNYFEHLHLQSMQELISYFESNGYKQQELPKEIRELKSKVKKAISKYPSSKPLKKRIENLIPDEPKDEHYLALLRYVKRENHACPPVKHIEDGKKIGFHVSNVRQKHKKGRLSVEERNKYEALKGWRWNAWK